jgi:hypothetical protein
MGWSFTKYATKKDVIQDIMKGWTHEGSKRECIAHCVRGNILWTVWRVLNPEGEEIDRWIGCDILGAEKDYGWGNKSLEESSGPAYYTCPIKYLDMVPRVASESWRKGVREYHTLGSNFQNGDTLKFEEPITFTDGTKLDTLIVDDKKKRIFVTYPNSWYKYRLSKYVLQRKFEVVKAS